MAQPQHQADKLASWPLQLDGHLNGIKETFNLLSQELDATRRERDEYKAQLDAQAKELDDFRKFVGLQALPGDATFGNDEDTEFTATSPDDDVFESAGSPLDDSDKNATSEVSKSKGSSRNTEFNSGIKKLLDMKLVYTLCEGDVKNVRFSPDGKYLATVWQDGLTKIYETETGNNVCVLVDRYLTDKYTHAENRVAFWDVCFSPNNRYLATDGEDSKIRIWDIGKKGIRNIFKSQGLIGYTALLDFLPSGRFIVSGSSDGIRVSNMRTGTSIIFKGPGNAICTVRSSPDGRYIAAGTEDRVLIWDIRSRALVNSLEHPGYVTGVDFAQDGKRLVSGSSKGTLQLWDISSLKLGEQRGLGGQQQAGTVDGVQCLRDFVDAGYVCAVGLSYDGRWVLSGSFEGGAYFWDTRNAKRQRVVKVPRISAHLVACSPVGDYLAVGTSDHRVMVWTYRVC